MVDGFEQWADRGRDGVPRRLEVARFQAMPHREQAELVRAAQAFPELAPVVPVPAPIVDADPPVDEEDPMAWL